MNPRGLNRRYKDKQGANSFFTATEDRYPLRCIRTFTEVGSHVSTQLGFRSPVLLQILRDIIAPSPSREYQWLFSDNNTAKMAYPYVILFQNRQRIQAAASSKTDERQRATLHLLLDFMKSDLPSTWQKLDEIEAGTCTHISFHDAWLLYTPGTTIFKKTTSWRAYKVQTVEANFHPTPDPIELTSFFLDFSDCGTKMVPAKEDFSIAPYSGDRCISDLEVIPASHLPNRSSICDELRARGETFWQFNGSPAYRQYSGNAWPTTLASVCPTHGVGSVLTLS